MSVESLRLDCTYKALSAFSWTGIPRFVVLTGANGVGKTQLLELLAASVGVRRFDGVFAFMPPELALEPAPKGVGYLPALWQPAQVRVSHAPYDNVDRLVQVAQMHARAASDDPREKLQAVGDLFQTLDIAQQAIVTRFLDALRAAGKLASKVTRADVLDVLGPYALVNRDPMQPLVALGQVFHAYYSARAAALMREQPREQVDRALGPPPWKLANDLLRSFRVRYTLQPPEDARFVYELLCRDAERHEAIAPGDLSSGEQAILALVAMVVTATVLSTGPETAEQVPDLLLLDEPDAHLHASSIKAYLGHVQQLTERGAQVIMVTHRPDTMVLAPAGSLHEMRRVDGTTSIVPVASRSELVGRFSEDTIAILSGVRVVLVEAEADRRFHQWAYERALKLGLLLGTPRLVFVPVSAVGGGGKDPAVNRLAMLRREGLGAVHRALIDRDDDGAVPLPPGVQRLARRALENYLVDPIALYCAVVARPDLDEQLGFSAAVGIGRGDLDVPRRAGAEPLARIAEVVLQRFEAAANLTEGALEPVTLFGEGEPVTLEYPGWLRLANKKALRAAVQKALGDAALNAEHFHGGPELSGLVPADLVDVYRTLVNERL